MTGTNSSGRALSGTITVWDWFGKDTPAGKSIAALEQQFMASHPGVKIKHAAQPLSQYDALLRAAFSSRTGPDALVLYSGASGVLNYTKTLEPLNKLITPSMRKRLTGWDVVSENYNIKKRAYGVPFNLQGIVIYYNKALFRQAGLDPNKPPQTYDQLVAAGNKLKAAGIVPFSGGDKEGYMGGWALDIFWPGVATPAQTLALGRGTIKFTDPIVVKTIQRYIDLVNAKFFDSGMLSTPYFPDAVDQFARGKQAMIIGLVSTDANYASFNPTLGTSNVGVMQVFGINKSTPYYLPTGAGLSWSIPSYSKNKALAWEYIKFITSSAAQRYHLIHGTVTPTDTTVVPPARMAPQLKEMLATFNKSKLGVWPEGVIEAPVLAELYRQVQLVEAGNKSVAEAMAAVQELRDKS